MKKVALIIVLCLGMASAFSQTTYYVSNAGSDSNNGTSASTPWRTVAHVNGETFSPGDSILFRRGDTWREVLRVPSSGNIGAYITFGAYGTGNKPRFFSQSIQCNNWTSAGYTNIWISSTVVPDDPFQISWQSDIMVEELDGLVKLMYNREYTSNFSNLGREYDWTWNNERIYVYSPTDPDTRYTAINAPQVTTCIELADQEYIAFDNLDVRYAVLAGITDEYWTTELHGLRVTNCHIAGIGSLGGPYAYGIQSHHSDAYFGYNEVYSCGRRSISVNLYAGTPAVSIENVLCEYNYFHHGWHTTGFDCAIAESSTGHTITNVTVRNNLFEGDPNQTFETGTGHSYPPSNHIFIAEQSDNNGGISNVYVYNNIFTCAHGKSIIFENLHTAYAVYNTIYGWNQNLDLWQSTIGTGYSTDFHILNNIIVHDQTNTVVGLFHSGAATTMPSTLDYNLWYVEDQTPNEIALVSFYQSAPNGFLEEYFINSWDNLQTDGYETHSPDIADPMFVDPQYVGGDFRLQPSSPAIGAAIPVAWITTDFYGNPRHTTAPSIGAVEPLRPDNIIDHKHVAYFDSIPQQYIDSVKKRWISYAGESHSEAIRSGLNALESLDSRFQVSTQESGTPAGATSSYLRASRATWGDLNNPTGWIYSYGEEDWFTSTTARTRTLNGLSYANTNGYRLDYFGFGWCYDATYPDVGGLVDPVFHTRWGGATVGSLDGEQVWGLDSGDSLLTGNRVDMDEYISYTVDYIEHCETNNYPTTVFFTTGTVDNEYGISDDENGYQQYLKWQYIRDFCQNTDYMLFDYADILCYNDDDELSTTTWTDYNNELQTYPIIHSDNLGGGYVAHIGENGALRLAKALWVMMAINEGWTLSLNGSVPEDPEEPPIQYGARIVKIGNNLVISGNSIIIQN